MATAYLAVLGPVTLQLSGAAPLSLGRRAQLLLALLAIAGPVGSQRADLAGLVWDDSSPPDARNALRQCLHQLRRGCGGHELICVSANRLAIDAERCIVDLWQFRSTAGAEALKLYAGPVAQGICGSEAAHGLLERETEVVHGRVIDLAESVARGAGSSADVPFAVAAVENLLAHDVVNESAWRALMRLHARGGEAAKAAHVWERCRDALRGELAVAPSRATREVFESVAPALAGQGPAAAAAGSSSTAMAAYLDGTLDPAAVDHMLRGWHLLNEGTPHANDHARHAFEAAAVRHAGTADALAMLGWTHIFDFTYGWSRDVAASFRAAEDHAQRALRAGPARAAPYVLQGRCLQWRSRFDEAWSHLDRALALAPQSAHAHSCLALLHVHAGRPEVALPLLERALQIEPHDNGAVLNVLGWALFFAGRDVDALEVFERGAMRNPRYCQLHAGIAAACGALGETERGRRAARRSRMNNRRLSLAFARDVLPFARDADRQRLIDAWSASHMPRSEAPYEALGEVAPESLHVPG